MPSSVVLSHRSYHFSVGRNRSTFYWGGRTWDKTKEKFIPVADLEYLYELDVADKWKKHLLKGQHPPGVYDGACTVVGDRLYFYGGKDKEGDLTGSLFELNLNTKSWRELSCPGTGEPKKKHSCGMVAYNSTIIIYGGRAYDGPTNELQLFDLEAGTWSCPHVTGDIPPPDYWFTFTKVSNHQVVLHGGRKNKGTYVLDLSRMHWKKRHPSESEVVTGDNLVATCLGLDSDHAQLLLLDPLLKCTCPRLLDIATWKWMEMTLPSEVYIPFGCSATALQTSQTSAEIVVYAEKVVRLNFQMQPSAPEGVSPVQWWILTEYTHGMEKYKLEVGDVRAAGLSKPTDPQTSSSTPEKTGDIVGEGQDVSANMSEVSISELQSEKTSSMESNEVAAQPGLQIQ